MNLSELRKRPHLSNSAINQLLNVCSLQYYFEKIAKLPKPFVSSSLVFGTCIHRTLESYFNTLKVGKEPDLDLHLDMFSEMWLKAGKDQTAIKYGAREDHDSLACKGREMIRCFVDHISPDEKIVEVSQAFAVPVYSPDGQVVELPLIGEFDLVIEKDGQPVIVDWKSSARSWSTGSNGQAEKSFQATVYSYAMHQLTGIRPEIRFDVVTKATKQASFKSHSTFRTEDDEKRMALMISKAQQIVKHELYYPSETGFYCSGCPYAGACKEWHNSCPAAQKAAA